MFDGQKLSVQDIGVLLSLAAAAVSGLVFGTVVVYSYSLKVDDAQKNLGDLTTQVTELRAKIDRLEAEPADARGVQGAKGDRGEQGPPGPQGAQGERGADGRDADMARISALEQKLNGLLAPPGKPTPLQPITPSPNPSPVPGDQKIDLVGIWYGSVACSSLQYSVTLTINDQTGSTGRGKWEYTGSNSGSTNATLGPSPSEADPKRYVLVTDGSNTFDYYLSISGKSANGSVIGRKCGINLDKQ